MPIDPALFLRLAAPFPADAVEWKPQVLSADKTRALAICYIDARCVMDRLDEVVGVAGWRDEFVLLPDGCVQCRLSLRIGGDDGREWITKEDVGSPSDQPDAGDKMKAAFSDSIKRAAVKFGVGRYLYSLPQQWAPYDAQRRQFKQLPALPAWALPQKAAGNGRQPAPAHPTADPAPAPEQRLGPRLEAYERRLVARGLCRAGELIAAVRAAGAREGRLEDLSAWDAEGVRLAARVAKEFEAEAGRHAARITPEQHRELSGMLLSYGSDPADFCAHFGIDDTDLLPAVAWDEAKRWITTRTPAEAVAG